MSTSPPHLLLHVFESTDALSQDLSIFIKGVEQHAVKEHGVFSVTMSGGSAPAIIGKQLTQPSTASMMDWPFWRLFFVDERCVSLNDPESNYRLTKEHILDKIPLEEQNVFPIAENLSPEQTATEYESRIFQTLGDNPRFDLQLLGVGPDGHLASLFPGHPLFVSRRPKYIDFITDSPKPPAARITFSFQAIKNSRRIAFIVSGDGKAGTLKTALEGPYQDLPAEAINRRPCDPSSPIARDSEAENDTHSVTDAEEEYNKYVHWFVDAAAASQLDLSNPHKWRQVNLPFSSHGVSYKFQCNGNVACGKHSDSA
eukprot:GILJ01006231.1.p1 GENE.GILJ01006231.1~~GILJ01006231.1.p1  ORF type:complete len:313 (+),score=43.93 GILJ01006231.1:59-997(+)